MTRHQRRREWAAVLLAATVLAYVGYILISAVQSAKAERSLANRAVHEAQTVATNSHNRINQLQTEIANLEAQIQHSGRVRARQIGQLRSDIIALRHQLKSLGVTPVVSETTVVHHQTVQDRTAVKPTPRPTATVTRTPTPRPSSCVGMICLPTHIPPSRPR